VAELALDLQAKLLRALEEGEVRPVGASEPTPVDVRVVSATHRDLKAEVGRGRFREDIYYRLAAITLRLPPLRERREDIPELARSLLSDLGARYPGGKAEIGSDALEALVSYRWPGNVRELRNVMERAAVLCEGGTILRSDLPPDVVEGGLVVEEQGEVFTLAAAEARAIAAALRKTGGKKGEAAKLLGISWPTLRRKLKLYGLAASTPPMRGRERPE
jgi:DNA-binding NtrC family response regulator